MPRGIKSRIYKGIFESVFNKIKRGAVARQTSFSVSLEYIGDLFEKQKGKCALTGVTLKLKVSKIDSTATASLDRKDSSKGYIRGNLQWIHKDINRLKSDFKQDILLELCRNIVNFENEKLLNNGTKDICRCD